MENYFSSCLLCGSGNLLRLEEYQSAHLAQCQKCSFIFSLRIPHDQELRDHYATYPANPSISDITVKRYHELLDRFEKFRENNNILDVGCGDGFFLHVAKKRGWNVYGTEYRADVIKKCSEKGINMKQGKLAELGYGENFFDIVTSFEVLEHINNPAPEFSAFQKIVRGKGGLYITTPNFNSLSRYISGNKWNVIEYPEHLCYYTKESLEKALKRYGFRIQNYEITGINLSHIINHADKQHSASSAITGENIRETIEHNVFLYAIKKITNSILTFTRKGDTLKILFEKAA